MKTIIFILLGIIAVIILLLGIGLLVVVLVWFWNYKRHRMKKIIKRFIRRTVVLVGLMKEEVKDDIQYTAQQVKMVVEKHKKNPSLQEVVDLYWVSVRKIIKSFFTKN